MIKYSYEGTNKGHLLQGLVVFVLCVQFESYLYPFRTVSRFNIRFDLVTLHKAKLNEQNNASARASDKTL